MKESGKEMMEIRSVKRLRNICKRISNQRKDDKLCNLQMMPFIPRNGMVGFLFMSDELICLEIFLVQLNQIITEQRTFLILLRKQLLSDKRRLKWKKAETEHGRSSLPCISNIQKAKLTQQQELQEDMMKTIQNHLMTAEKRMKSPSKTIRIDQNQTVDLALVLHTAV